MAVRRFTEDELRLSIGAANMTGALTAMVLARPQAETEGTFLSLWDPTTERGRFGLNASRQPRMGIGVTNASGGEIGYSPAVGAWGLSSYSKGAGSVPPRWHHDPLSEAPPAHANDSTNLANPASQAGGTFRVGSGGLGSGTFDVAAIALWAGTALSDEAIDALAGAAYLIDWLAASPSALLLFDQVSVDEAVIDRTGNGADQVSLSGTESLGVEPPIPYEPAPSGPRPSSRALLGVGR